MKKCDYCEAMIGEHYCGDCNFVYCKVCERGHQKNKFTDHHKSSVIAETSENTELKDLSPFDCGTCKTHRQAIVCLCNPCQDMLCDACKVNHKGHDILPYCDIGTLQKICGVQIQTLRQALASSGNSKEAMTKRKSLCAEAKQVIKETIKRVIDTITALGKDTEYELSEMENIGDQHDKDVSEFETRADAKLSILTALSNVGDVSVLLPESAATAALLKKLVDVRNTTDSLDFGDRTANDLLPYLGKVDEVLEKMKDALQLNTDFGKTANAANFLASELEAIPIQNTDATNYVICDSGDKNCDHIFIHGRTDIHKIQIKTGHSEKYQCEYELSSAVEIEAGKYVAVDYGADLLFSLNEKFKVQHHIQVSRSKLIQDICYQSPNTILVLQKEGMDTFTITQLKVKSDKFEKQQKVEITSEENPWFICAHSEPGKVCMVSAKYLYIVSMANSTVKTHDMALYLEGSHCACVYADGCNILVGDESGVLHLLDSDMKHRTVTEADGAIRGITKRKDVYYVMAGGELIKFKIL